MEPPPTSGRAGRTREQVVAAFARLARERSYDRITVRALVEGAGVPRSTFYDHFRGKDDVLAGALSIFYERLADQFQDALEGRGEPESLAFLLEHFAENRLLLRRLTSGPALEAYTRSLRTFAALLAQRLEGYRARHGLVPRLPLEAAAAALAGRWR